MKLTKSRWQGAYVLVLVTALVACIILLQSTIPTQAAIQSRRVYLVPVPVPVPIMVRQKVTAYSANPKHPKRPHSRRPYDPSHYSPYGPPTSHYAYDPHHYHHHPAPSPYVHYTVVTPSPSASSPSPSSEPCPDEKAHNHPHPSEVSHSERNPFTGPLNSASSSPIASALMSPSGASNAASSLAALSALAAASGSPASAGQFVGVLNKALLGLNQRPTLALGKLISGEAKMLSPTAFLSNQIEPVDGSSSSSAPAAPPQDMFDDSSRSESSPNSKSDSISESASSSGESVVAIGERPKNSELSRLLQIREKLDSVAQAVNKEQQQQQQQQQQLSTTKEAQDQLHELLATVSQSSRLNDKEQLLEALRIIRERQSEEVLTMAAHHLGLLAR